MSIPEVVLDATTIEPRPFLFALGTPFAESSPPTTVIPVPFAVNEIDGSLASAASVATPPSIKRPLVFDVLTTTPGPMSSLPIAPTWMPSTPEAETTAPDSEAVPPMPLDTSTSAPDSAAPSRTTPDSDGPEIAAGRPDTSENPTLPVGTVNVTGLVGSFAEIETFAGTEMG